MVDTFAQEMKGPPGAAALDGTIDWQCVRRNWMSATRRSMKA
ncbi:hypothetical protein [Burkholderia stagnalis]|nr:hypothetical protein [Burkholderia stagnalis]